MKYLLTLLFLFSTQAFSGELDGKGIECNAIRLATGKTEIDMWWFNNDRVQIVYAQNTKPVTRRPSSEILDINNTFHTYSTTADEVQWASTVFRVRYFNYLNRKTLEYKTVDTTTDNEEVIVKGTCRVLTGFEEVLKKQDEYIKKQDEVEKKREEEYRKASEGNKI
jgi:hypothetical protein